MVSVGAAVLGVVIAFLASPLMPIGLARVAEPYPGFSFDALVLGMGSAAAIVATGAIAAVSVWRTTAGRYAALEAAERRARPSFVAEKLSRAGLPPTLPTGARMALESGRGRTAVPARATIIGAALAVAAVTASLTVAASFQHLFDSPPLYGWNWDAALGNPYGGDVSKRILPKLEGNPLVAGYSGGNILASVELSHSQESFDESTFGIDQIEGHVHPPVTEGRWPTGKREIALGTKTLQRLHADLGDTIQVAVGSETLSGVRIVGRAVFIDLGSGGLGRGAGMSLQGLRVLVPDVQENIFMLDLAPGATSGELSKSLGDVSDTYTLLVIGRTVEGDEVSSFLRDLRPVKRFPLLLAALLALAAVATIAHTLVTSIRRRRRDLAILKTLGFVRGQVSASVAWQATTLAVVSLLLGVPLGVIARRWAWTAFADQLGIVPAPAIPVIAVLLVVPATLVVANLVAALPGRIGGRIRPAAVLRTE
jgi:hypothetical protein